MDALFVNMVIRTILIVAITDLLIFRALMNNISLLTWVFVIEVIVVTIVPLVINLWYDIIYKMT